MSKSNRLSILVILALLATVVSGSLYGQSGIFDRTGIIPGHGAYSSLPEERVDLFTGNLTLGFRDIFLPGPNGLNIEVWRVYNSKTLYDKLPSQQYPTVQAYPKSMLGIGWTMHMGMVRNAFSSTPEIVFPDGRREIAFPPKSEYGWASYYRITRDFLKYYCQTGYYPKLYFQNGTVWTFGNIASLPLANGSSETVYMVTRIEDPLGNFIDIEYDAADSLRSISKITDSMGREVRFVKSYQGSSPAKLAEIRTRNANDTSDVIYGYAVGSFSNGFYKLTSFAPPELPQATYEYNDGLSNNYELTRVTTSFGGVLEYSYNSQSFYFNTTQLDSKVVSQKRIIFNAGEQAKVWDYVYPSYQGVSTGTTTVTGPEYSASATHYGYESTSANRWRIGLQTANATGDGSASSTTAWTYHEISTTIWSVLGISMGTAKGPLVSVATESRTGDSTLATYFYYLRTGVKRYGLPTKLSYLVNGAPSAKFNKELVYFFEAHAGFMVRYMLAYVENDKDTTAAGARLRETITSYFEEAGKWGALKQVKRWKTGTTYLTWDYTYHSISPEYYSITVDGPGSSGITAMSYKYGLEQEVTAPDYLKYTRHIYKYGSVLHEWNQYGGSRSYAYDDLGRTTMIEWRHAWEEPEPPEPPDPPDPFLTISYNWQPEGQNKVVITQGGHTITRYWDGFGRDLGSTESGDGTTLYDLKTLDAEGRIKEETNGSINLGHKYFYSYDAAGRITQVTDPVNKTTTVQYAADRTKTVTDPESHSTIYAYNDLPGLPTRLTDAQGHIANYTYDDLGRLCTVVYNGARTQSYVYDPLDHVTSETHPETGTMSYDYNSENLLWRKSWGGTQIVFYHNTSGQLANFTGAETVTYGFNEKGAVESVTGTTGWSRTGIAYDDFGHVTAETVAVPYLGSKSLTYAYDDTGNLTETTYPDGKKSLLTFNDLGRPETLKFGQGTEPPSLVNSASYGPNKILAAVSYQNGTSMTSTFLNNGTPNTISLMKDSTPLYNATYGYDGAGNITSITSTAPAPALNSTFGYDSLNRLTSASYSTGAVGTYSYDYDTYGNMLTVRHDGNVAFSKTYKPSNQIDDSAYQYDSRGNLTAKTGSFYEWDAQNRLRVIRDAAGQCVADYRYDDRGRRIASFPPLPDIAVDCPYGSNADFTASLQTSAYRTFTITNQGLGSLNIGALTREGPDMDMFTVTQAPASIVPPGQSTEFMIRFLPTSTGDKTATLSITSDDLDENPYIINLCGFCEPEINTPTSYDFGTVTIGNYAVDTLYIENYGTATLVLYDWPPSVQGEDFGVVGYNGNSRIEPGHSNSFMVRFAPTSEGPKTGIITIGNNDLDENPSTITLTGTGLLGPPKIIEDDSELTLISPNGGEKLEAGSLRPITWSGGERVRDVKLEYSTDNGTSYRTIVERFSNVGTYPWRVPAELSGSCLVRISDADGTPTVPVLVSFEFNFRLSAAGEDPQDRPHFVFRAGLPDPKTQSFQVAEVAFAPDGVGGAENLLFNHALGEVQALDRFLGRWHHARITYDMTNYAGSVWVDGEPILTNIPLQTDLDILRPAEISLSRGEDVSVKLWIDDMDVRFIDQSLMGQNTEDVVFRPLFRDNFNRYESALFPREGGWLPGLEPARAGEQNQGETAEEGAQVLQAARTEEAASSGIDDGMYASSAKSFRLEGSQDEPGTVVKRFSLPDRVPFSVSAESFAIVEAGTGVPGERAGGVASERRSVRDERRQRRWESDAPDRKPGRPADKRRSGVPRPGPDSVRRNRNAQPGSEKMMSGAYPNGTYYIYSFDGRLLAEYDVSGYWIRDYIYFGGQLVAEYTNGALYYYASDQISSTRIVTDSTGTVVYSAAHEPYGGIQETWGVSTYDPELKFSGKQRDAESELDYFGARYYDRAQYRFISTDPVIPRRAYVHDPLSTNLYIYCKDNPIAFYDPDGKWPFIVHYNWTLAIGILVGMPVGLAKTIADANADIDKNLSTTAGGTVWTSFSAVINAFNGAIEKWHFPGEERLAECLNIARTTTNPKLFGQVLHAIQDSYIHAGYSAPFGHGFSGLNEDPMSNPLEAENTAWFTLDLMSDFYQRWDTTVRAVVAAVFSIALCL